MFDQRVFLPFECALRVLIRPFTLLRQNDSVLVVRSSSSLASSSMASETPIPPARGGVIAFSHFFYSVHGIQNASTLIGSGSVVMECVGAQWAGNKEVCDDIILNTIRAALCRYEIILAWLYEWA